MRSERTEKRRLAGSLVTKAWRHGVPGTTMQGWVENSVNMKWQGFIVLWNARVSNHSSVAWYWSARHLSPVHTERKWFLSKMKTNYYEAGFLAVTATKTISRSRVDVRNTLRIPLSNFTPKGESSHCREINSHWFSVMESSHWFSFMESYIYL